jgi:hypothetical protein
MVPPIQDIEKDGCENLHRLALAKDGEAIVHGLI